jgi:hypothetical protein
MNAKPPSYSKISIPILIRAGDEDKSAPLAGCKKMFGEIGTSEKKLEIMEGVDHWHCLEAFDEVVKLIEGVLPRDTVNQGDSAHMTYDRMIGDCEAVRICRRLGVGAVIARQHGKIIGGVPVALECMRDLCACASHSRRLQRLFGEHDGNGTGSASRRYNLPALPTLSVIRESGKYTPPAKGFVDYMSLL